MENQPLRPPEALQTNRLRTMLSTVYWLPIFLVTVLASGCATSYQPMGSTGGFEQTQIDANTFSIRFYGNSFTSLEDVNQYARLRAAEIGRQLDFQYVVFLGQEDRSVTQTYSTPTTTNTTGTLNTYGNTGTYSGTSTTYGGTQSMRKPRVEIYARFFEERPEGKYLELYQVDDLYRQLTSE